MATTVTSKGRVTIPKAVRSRLGLQPGHEVKFELAFDGRVFLTRVDETAPESRYAALRGRAGAGLTTDQVMALTRGEPAV